MKPINIVTLRKNKYISIINSQKILFAQNHSI